MASDGAAPSAAPGVTIGGTGSHCSVSSGLAAAAVSFGASAAFPPATYPPAAMSSRHRQRIGFFIDFGLLLRSQRPARQLDAAAGIPIDGDVIAPSPKGDVLERHGFPLRRKQRRVRPDETFLFDTQPAEPIQKILQEPAGRGDEIAGV